MKSYIYYQIWVSNFSDQNLKNIFEVQKNEDKTKKLSIFEDLILNGTIS